MRLLLFIIAAMFAAQSASAQSLWRNFFTTNRNPIVEVVAGSNATVQASTVGVNLRRFTVNSIPGGTASAQTNISWTAITNVDQIQIPLAGITNANHVTNWALVPTNYVPLEAQHATNADFAAYATNAGFATNAEFVTTATLTNQIYASNVVSGGQITVNALASNTPSASQVLTATSSSSAAWQDAASGSIPDPRLLNIMFDDFAGPLSSSVRSGDFGFIHASGNSGANPAQQASETNSPWLQRLSTSTSATGYSIIQQSTSPLFNGTSAYIMTNEWKFRLNDMPSASEKYNAWIGYSSFFNFEPPSDCVQLLWQTNSANFLFRTGNNNSRTTVDTGVTVTEDVWHTVKIVTLQDTNALVWLDGTYRTNITSNLPSTRSIQIGVAIKKEVGTTASTMDVDYCYGAIVPVGGR